MTVSNEYNKLHEQCRLVKGYTRGIIYDLGRENYYLVPNNLINYIHEIDENKTGSLQPQSEIIEEFNKFIGEQELMFSCSKNELDFFPKLDLTWKASSLITNCIFQFNNSKLFKAIENNLTKILESIQVEFIEIRINKLFAKTIAEIEIFMDKISSTGIIGIYIVIFTDKQVLDSFGEHIRDLVSNHKRIVQFIIYNDQKELLDKSYNLSYKLRSGIKNTKLNPKSNIQFFTESQLHHTYFNRKLYIGPKGEIKNAPECKEEFGYIQDLETPEEILKIVEQPAFQKYWYVHKELCDVCKDCEFRHMCVDNRLPYQREDGSWYHKQECNYNPYICKWEGEDGYQTLTECGVEITEKGYKRDDQKIAAINQELWPE